MLSDPRRTEPAYVSDERTMLDAWLEFHRATLLLKCEGMDDVARKSRPVSTSRLSLHGLIRHMAEVERTWFQRTLLGRTDAPKLFPGVPGADSELVPLDDAEWEADLATWHYGHADLIRELVDGPTGW